LSRFQQEIRLVRTKILEIERKIEEKKSSKIELKKDFEQVISFPLKKKKNSILSLFSYLDKIRHY
jgi:hypothetical protein